MESKAVLHFTSQMDVLFSLRFYSLVLGACSRVLVFPYLMLRASCLSVSNVIEIESIVGVVTRTVCTLAVSCSLRFI